MVLLLLPLAMAFPCRVLLLLLHASWQGCSVCAMLSSSSSYWQGMMLLLLLLQLALAVALPCWLLLHADGVAVPRLQRCQRGLCFVCAAKQQLCH